MDFVDFASFAFERDSSGCGFLCDCGKADLDLSGKVDFADLAIFADYWLTL